MIRGKAKLHFKENWTCRLLKNMAPNITGCKAVVY